MKVLHVIPSISMLRGGPSHAVLGMAKALRELGIDAEIATTNDDGDNYLDVPLRQRIEHQHISMWVFPYAFPQLKEYLFSQELTRWLWDNIKTYDLIHTHYLFSYPSTCAGLLARWHNIPYVVSTIGQLTPWALDQSRFKKKVYSRLIEHHNLNRAAAIHCTTHSEAEDTKDFGIKSPPIILPLGVERGDPIPEAKAKLHHRLGIAEDVPIILFFSRLHYKKRPDLLLRSLETLSNTHRFHLIIAGAGAAHYTAELKALTATLNLTSQVSFAGFVSGFDKDLLLQGADLFALPSFSENFGVAVVEAMAAGMPVIVTPGIHISSEVKDFNAGLIVDGEIKPLAAAIAQLLTSPQMCQTLGQNGQRLVEDRYSWDAIGQELASSYSTVLETYR